MHYFKTVKLADKTAKKILSEIGQENSYEVISDFYNPISKKTNIAVRINSSYFYNKGEILAYAIGFKHGKIYERSKKVNS